MSSEDINTSGISGVLKQCFVDYLKQLGQNQDTITGVYDQVIKEVEIQLIATALDYTDGNKTKAAEILGISRNTLHRKLMEFNEKF